MTWRKLFLFLLSLSLLVLAVAWVSSLRYRTDLTIHPWSLRLSLVQGAVESTTSSLRGNKSYSTIRVGSPVSLSHTPFPPAPVSHPFGQWKIERYETEWEFAAFIGSVGPEGIPVWVHDAVRIPMWALWLLFTGCAYALCRIMEKRSASAKEKRLAEKMSLAV